MKGFELSSLNLHGKAPSEGAMWSFQVLRSGADVTGSILWGNDVSIESPPLGRVYEYSLFSADKGGFLLGGNTLLLYVQ